MSEAKTRTFGISTKIDERTLVPTFTIHSDASEELFSAAVDRLYAIVRFFAPGVTEPFATAHYEDHQVQEVSFRGSTFTIAPEGLIHKKHIFTTLSGQRLAWTSHIGKEIRCEDEHGKQVAMLKDGGLTGNGKQLIEADAGLGEEVLISAVVMMVLQRNKRGELPGQWILMSRASIGMIAAGGMI